MADDKPTVCPKCGASTSFNFWPGLVGDKYTCGSFGTYQSDLCKANVRIRELEAENASFLATLESIANGSIKCGETYIAEHDHLGRYYYPALLKAIQDAAFFAIVKAKGGKR